MIDRERKFIDIQEYRDEFIKALDKSNDKTQFVEKNSDTLYNLGLTMYSREYSFSSAIFNAFSLSQLDESISLHPVQLKALELINKNRGLIFSAPTSFGKTFVIFEYIARERPNNIVLIVPTLALIDEYKKKIIKQYREVFKEYKVYLSINEENEYDFSRKNIFILTHDRVVNDDTVNIIQEIDFLVIDEVYKLQKEENNDRVLVLNLAYHNMVCKSKKYVLLAPFIKGVQNLDKLDDIPEFYGTNYSPVVNDVVQCNIIDEKERNNKAVEIINQIDGNTLVYFPRVYDLNKFINEKMQELPEVAISNTNLVEFIKWGEEEIHSEWSLLKAIKRGYFVHHGQLPLGIRLLQLDLFNNNGDANILLCTSTLLEGVNTTAKNIIITKPARGKDNEFDAFDFYNLVGRTGRLFQHYLGKAYYIKGPKDREYSKVDALKSIEFELTENSIDIDINCKDYTKHPEFTEFLERLNIDYESYKRNVATKCRFSTALFLYSNYITHKTELLNTLRKHQDNDQLGKLDLVRILYRTVNSDKRDIYLKTQIINKVTYLTRLSVKKVISELRSIDAYKERDIEQLISSTLYLKNSYVEFEFYTRITIIQFFMLCDKVDSSLIDLIHEKLTRNIEILYYLNSPPEKLLKDMGVHDRDINKIIAIIGNDFETVQELQTLLRRNESKLRNISVISRYVINSIIN